MRISRETDYAIRCVLHLAIEPEKVAMVEDIARARDIPKSFLAKILQKLNRAGIVKSFRGVKGGFRLARNQSLISLLDVINAVQGGISVNVCAVDENACERTSKCVIHPIWKMMRGDLEALLGKYDFKSLSDAENGIEGQDARMDK